MAAELKEGLLFGICNPLLDMAVSADKELLDKYSLKPNDAILAEEKHLPLYDELVKNYKVEYSAGGSGQNTCMVVQWLLEKPHLVVYSGSVGKDKYSQILEDKAHESGLKTCYQYQDSYPTGTCAVLITGNGTNRSLCANLAAANHFSHDHLHSPENKKLVQQAEYYYATGFFLTVCFETVLELAQIAHQRNKLFMMNLSAPFICLVYAKQQMQVMPYVDIIFGNDDEAKALAKEQGFETEDIKEIALKIADLPKQNTDRSRTVVITQGHNPVIFVKDGKVEEFEVPKVPAEKIIDTNGAGDAFVGGYLAQLILGKPYQTSIKCGMWAASEIIQVSGTSFKGKKYFNGDS
ncbi:unnamed protein product [Bemisia tabaci]|uniref:Adenosine kinase n=1 Tax=Bemisia tabaci TaxID=7038 RepID=A0A9P0G433_BEMTA|nr:unnamed protein product [Bemisia tabaci]